MKNHLTVCKRFVSAVGRDKDKNISYSHLFILILTCLSIISLIRSTRNLFTLSLPAALYQQSGEKVHEEENLEYQRRKVEDLQQRLSIARSSIHHNELVTALTLVSISYHDDDL